MNRESHLQMDMLLFNGRCYPMVHDWIDGTYGKNGDYGYSHWLNRHHVEAIADKFTGEMELSAHMHILSDWISHWNLPIVPINRKDVIEKLREVGYYQEGDYIE